MYNDNKILPRGVVEAQFLEDCNNYDDDGLIEKYNVSYRTIKRWKQRIRENEDEIMTMSFPESPSPQCLDYLKLDYERLIIIGDVEIPDHDPVLLEMVARLAEKLGIERLLINGDFMAMDAFSNWPAENPQATNFNRDKSLAIKIIKTFLNSFDTVDYIIGNHERRLARQTKGQSNIGMFFEHVLEVQYSNYPYCELTSGGKEILICHQEDYSRTPLQAPLKLAAIHHKNILCGHTHRLASGFDPSGKYWVAEGGHGRSEERTMYKCMKMASNPKWNKGFSIIYKGQIYLINKENYDFWINNVNLGR